MKAKLLKVFIFLFILFVLGFVTTYIVINGDASESILDTVYNFDEAVFNNSVPYIISEPTENLPVVEEVPEKEIISAPDASAEIENYNFSYSVISQTFQREEAGFDSSEPYSDVEGVTCFRGNNLRNGGSFGNIDLKEEKLEKLWEVNIGAIDSWTGVGWNGQTAIVKWSEEIKKDMNLYEEKKNKKDLTEVIYAALDGYVHFLDLEDGKATRDKLWIGAPIKGSLTVDPRGLPLLYVGQGIDKRGSQHVSFAYRIFSLTDFSKLYEIKGMDDFAVRKWGAFDSTSLIDKKNDFFYICGENGLFYSGKLNTNYENGKVTISPQIDKYKYSTNKTKDRGIENSIAIYENYGFFADNDGILQCLDLRTLKPVWARYVNDDTDSTIVLERDNEGLNLYTASEVDKQGNGGYSFVRKINGATGGVLWENKYKCYYDSNTNGGALATPISGKEELKELAIFNIARTPNYNSGILVAMNKNTGEEVWKLILDNYCWSSPLALYSKDGKGYIIQCDSAGRAFLIEGISGKILDIIDLEANVEGTPAAFDDIIVVGTRGGKIIGFKVK
ncbi:pyrrolo-quinoline quinone [Clostridium thermarum]|uniref:pyrrolo-quinoline quinone n=1 Tax=Clostridium thermarum TaxID=1716543 RepID=UPI0013D5D617|nr:pyrrolo-quinoline quinone [Clostridium thermarum]